VRICIVYIQTRKQMKEVNKTIEASCFRKLR
jgi:hypothetical protein